MSEPTNVATAVSGGADAAPVASDDAMKVFAGNLAFATTEEELKSVFAEAGAVTQAQIIKRGTRSLGYGFVTYETEAEAQKAVQLLNKKEIAGREINVEGAKPQSDLAKHNDSGNYTLAEGEEGEDGKGAVRGGKGRGRGRARGRGARGRGGATSRRPRADDGEEELEDPIKENGAEEGAATNGGLTKSARRRQKKAAAKQADANGETAAAAAVAGGEAGSTEKKVKTPREPRKPKGAPKGEPSKTLLFVANLPFQFSDEELKSAFDGFQVKSAKVVKRRFGTRTKGFGFVDLENEEEQLRALKEVHGKQVEGRDLQLKIAIQGDDRKENEEEVANAEAAAEAEPAPAA